MSELPDYNPDGTANPKGDASYWRARAEQAESDLDHLVGRFFEYETICNNGELGASVLTMSKRMDELEAENARLTAENERLSQMLHDELSQLEIATDLGNKRYIALNQIYEDGEKHNANWCKRKAQEGLGIKND